MRGETIEKLRQFAKEFDLLERLAPFQHLRWSAPSPAALHLDDVSGIPFLDGIAGIDLYQHRARTRCGDGDLFAAVTEPVPGYEDYCRELLGMGSPTFVKAEPAGSLIEVAEALRSSPGMATICDEARSRGGLEVHPYMGIESVWALAEDVHQATGVPIQVLAPPPPITWIANDKANLNRLIAITAGPEYAVDGEQGRDLNLLADAMLRVASRHRRIGLKRGRCASAMGNGVYAADEVRNGDPAAILRTFIERTEWDGGEDLIVCGWLDAIASPSTQLWIPPHGSGKPRLDGVYEQLLEGEECCFLGSRPSILPAAVNEELVRASMAVAEGLQWLGYVGRCSFDFVLCGDPEGAFSVHFTECNGRWGGTSTPMALVDRLVPGPRPAYRAQDVVIEGHIGAPFSKLLDGLGDSLYRPGRGGNYILYNVGPLEGSGKFDVIAIADSPERAAALIEEDLLNRLGA